jgi:UDP-N-acetylglucosamine 4,6-dehydratase/5-epimerase
MSYRDKKFLITGGTGSLGKALIKRLKKEGAHITVFSRDEGKQAFLRQDHPEVQTFIGCVRDYERVLEVFMRVRPDYVIHAGALKRIDDGELNETEFTKTNVNGSRNVAEAAVEAGVTKCMLVSTDKACLPVNNYGKGKSLAEGIFTSEDYKQDNTILASVRYGNVIASRGSAIPLFLGLLENDREISVTSNEMTRFFFTLDDAVDTVLFALDNARGGEIFIPQINSYTLPALIDACATIAGAKPKTKVTGLRPGEKLHEDMLEKTELPRTYKVPDINLLQVRPCNARKEYQNFPKYDGPHFNSELWVSDDSDDLVELIQKGLQC